ncbi:hypothetical protein IAD21_04214 [Abditibacteriota bacterium]|nr:hypothetical protein IAD21_04214 [Abditibacteriota bacterium]
MPFALQNLALFDKQAKKQRLEALSIKENKPWVARHFYLLGYHVERLC